MKKNIALLLSIITLIFIIISFKIYIPAEKGLSGKKITDYLYSYNLSVENTTISEFEIVDDNIYYLVLKPTGESDNYYLYKQNIYTNKKTLINSLKDIDGFCELNNKYISCLSNDTTSIYDLNLEEKLKTKTNALKNRNIIPYKDTFLIVESNNLILIQNNKEQVLITLDEDIKNYTYINYYHTKNNTFILYYNALLETYCIYDINNNTNKKINSKSYNLYESGFYFYDEEKYVIYDLKNNKTSEYENNLKMSLDYSILSNKFLYTYTDTLNIINPKENNIKTIPLDIEVKDNLLNLKIQGKYLFIHVLNIDDFYLIDTSKIPSKSINIKDYIIEEETKIINSIKNIKEKFNVNINIKNDAVIKYPDFQAEIEDNNLTIIKALEDIETILTKYNKEFFDTFYSSNYQGLNIYLTSNLTPNDYDTQISNPAAYSLVYQDKYMIVMDINEFNIPKLLCHELMHNLEFNLNNQNIEPFTKWDTYNPSSFYYNYSYTKDPIFNYTLIEEDINNIYFIDTYSHTYPTEDRARIFESICSCTKDSELKKYKHLYTKGLYLKEEILEYYKSLKSSSLFTSLD